MLDIFNKNIIVLSESGMPLSDANILFSKGNGTITNAQGRATVKAFFQTQKIIISHIGYTTQEFLFRELPDTIYLPSETASLDEVVIIASKPKPEILPEKKKNTLLWVGIGAALLLLTIAGGSKPAPKGLSQPKKPKSPVKKTPPKKKQPPKPVVM